MLLLTKYTVLYKENEICCIILLSLPSRERGLKLYYSGLVDMKATVAPFAGAWIEIINLIVGMSRRTVAPFAGAWIEILYQNGARVSVNVAPFAGAWIEICQN